MFLLTICPKSCKLCVTKIFKNEDCNSMFSKAKWIWNADASQVNAYADFVDTFVCSGNPVVRIACDGDYVLRINEKVVGFGQYRGYEDLQFYDEYALSDYVVSGSNQVSVTVFRPGVDSLTYRKGTPGLIYEIFSEKEVLCASSTKTMTRVNPQYTSGKSVPIVTHQLGFSFELDLTKSETAYNAAVLSRRSYEFRPRPVKKLDVLPEAPTVVVARGGFSDRSTGEMPAVVMSKAELKKEANNGEARFPSAEGVVLTSDLDGCFAIVDLEATNTGIFSLDIEVEKDTEILIGWGEHITDGCVRMAIDGRSFAAKITIPKGRHTVVHPFLRLGLRYLQLHVYAESCRIYYAGIQPTLYPLPQIVPAPVSDELHKKIYDVCIRTLHMCMHEHYEDCPWREQALYAMDSRNQMLCGYYTFGETAMPRASIELLAHSLREDGLLELCAPARIGSNIPSFSIMFIVQTQEYLKYSGDVAFVKEIFPTLKRLAETFIAAIEPNGLMRGLPGYWNFYEWTIEHKGDFLEQEDLEKRTYDAPLCGYFAMALKSLIAICREIHEDDTLYVEKYNMLKDNIDRFWNDEQQSYASFIFEGDTYHYSELTNALFLCAGIVPEDKQAMVRRKIMTGELADISLSHSIFKYDALLADPANKDFVMTDVAKTWGKMLELGATTFWETIDGDKDFDNAGSLCHGWSAVPSYVYFRVKDMEG